QACGGARVPRRARMVRGSRRGRPGAPRRAAGTAVAVWVDHRAGVHGAGVHSVEVDSPLRCTRRCRFGIPRAHAGDGGAVDTAGAGRGEAGDLAARRRSWVVRGDDRAGLARPEQLALLLAREWTQAL